MFLVEGPQAVREALTHAAGDVVDVFMTPEAFAKNADIVALAGSASIEIEQVSEQVLEQMADTTTPQGVIAVVQMASVTLEQVIGAKPNLLVVLDRVSDPGNAGTIIRVAVAAGATGVIVTSDSVDIYNPKVVRSTTGSIFHIPIVRAVELAQAMEALKSSGLQVIAADMTGVPLPELAEKGSLQAPSAWLMGNEAHGLDDSALAEADIVASVPQYGPVESMNLATAAAVCLFQSAFAQRHSRSQ
jgi:TrmH family RNA methyltransferase